MISRESASAIINSLLKVFKNPPAYISSKGFDGEQMKMLLYDCGLPRSLYEVPTKHQNRSLIVDILLGLHDGSTVYELEAGLYKDRELSRQKGNDYLLRIAGWLKKYQLKENLSIEDCDQIENMIDDLYRAERHLRSDGFAYNNGEFIKMHDQVVPQEESQQYIQRLFLALELNQNREKLVVDSLTKAYKRYSDGDWEDSVHSARRVLEATLMAVADKDSLIETGQELEDVDPGKCKTPNTVRQYLLSKKIIDEKELEVFTKIYGLISNKGSHINWANQNQASLLISIAMYMSQYVLHSFANKIGVDVGQLPTQAPR
jgi:hypothetical protein